MEYSDTDCVKSQTAFSFFFLQSMLIQSFAPTNFVYIFDDIIVGNMVEINIVSL